MENCLERVSKHIGRGWGGYTDIFFFIDSNEVTGTSVADAKSTTNEASEVPGGIVGFKLTYFQVSC